MSIPWPYATATYVSSLIGGYDEVGRALRRFVASSLASANRRTYFYFYFSRTIMRYECLSLTMVFRAIAPRVQKRFPKMEDLVEAGLLMKSELTIIEELDVKFPGYNKSW